MDKGPHAPVVVGVDGSPASDLAVRWAAKAAQREDRPLRIVHGLDSVGLPATFEFVVPPEDISAGEAIVARAESAARTLFPDLLVSGEVAPGDGADALIRASSDAALLVLGDNGGGDIADLGLGPLGRRVSMRANCPVVVIVAGIPT